VFLDILDRDIEVIQPEDGILGGHPRGILAVVLTGEAILRPSAAEDAKGVDEDSYRPCDEGDGVLRTHFAMADIRLGQGG
jgi:hypothetical protein